MHHFAKSEAEYIQLFFIIYIQIKIYVRLFKITVLETGLRKFIIIKVFAFLNFRNLHDSKIVYLPQLFRNTFMQQDFIKYK